LRMEIERLKALKKEKALRYANTMRIKREHK
jgi:hypothetical protein